MSGERDGSSSPVPQSAVGVAATLPAADFELLRPHLKSIDLVQGTVLFEAGDLIGRVYFPHSGLVSLVVQLASGEMIEAAMIGRRGVAGGMSGLDGQVTLNKAIVQIAGTASVMDVGRFRKVAEQSLAFRTMLIRDEQTLFAQVQQTAACNASHPVEARLSRWLLRARDITGSEILPLTQEFLAQMLGVRRSSVSGVANTLQQAGLISYDRGRIRITNVAGLRKASCECYEIIEEQYDRLLRDLTK